jgi:multidrug efflux pump subunit AcrA (membrane-fusion protein)
MHPPSQHRGEQSGQGEQALQRLVLRGEQGDAAAPASWRRRRWLAAALGALALAGAAAWLRQPSPAAPVPAAAPAESANSGPAPGSLRMTGFFTAHELVQISATVLARVKAIRVAEGASVKRGELLVELSNIRGDNDVRSAEQRLAAEKLAAEKAALDARNALQEQQRQAALMAQGFSTRKAMADADLRLDQARLELARSHSNTADAVANLHAFQSSQLEYAIRAPFAGVVVAQNARVGEVVSPTNGGSYIRSGLLTLLNPATLEVEVSVQERLLPQLQRGGCALVSSLAQPEQIRAVPFRLARVGNTADRQRGAVNVVLAPTRAMRVLPILDSSAEVEFVGAGDGRCSTMTE